MEHYFNMSVVNTDTKGAGRDHFQLPADLLLEEITTEREAGVSGCLQSLLLQNNNSSTLSFIFRIQLFLLARLPRWEEDPSLFAFLLPPCRCLLTMSLLCSP